MLLGYLEEAVDMGFPPDARLSQAADKAMMSLWECAVTSRVWFDPSLCTLLDQYLANHFLSGVRARTLAGSTAVASAADHEELTRLRTQGNALRTEIERRARELLDVGGTASGGEV